MVDKRQKLWLLPSGLTYLMIAFWRESVRPVSAGQYGHPVSHLSACGEKCTHNARNDCLDCRGKVDPWHDFDTQTGVVYRLGG